MHYTGYIKRIQPVAKLNADAWTKEREMLRCKADSTKYMELRASTSKEDVASGYHAKGYKR
jgi:hypothetical protein